MTMELTADQVDQIRSALAEGRRRISLTPTDVQRHLWRQEAATEDAYRDDTVARVGRIRAAATRTGVFGDLRRAIAMARIPDAHLAGLLDIEPDLLVRFREGEADLPAAAIERLAATLNLRLMHEIPRNSGA